MKKNLKNKIALIVAVLVICLYGIFGIPRVSAARPCWLPCPSGFTWAWICRAAFT